MQTTKSTYDYLVLEESPGIYKDSIILDIGNLFDQFFTKYFGFTINPIMIDRPDRLDSLVPFEVGGKVVGYLVRTDNLAKHTLSRSHLNRVNELRSCGYDISDAEAKRQVEFLLKDLLAS